MVERKPVYNGYKEKYLTGVELKELFAEYYYATGRHHSVILGLSISEYLYFLGINDSAVYRIFINQFFCRIMDGKTDKFISFFGCAPIKDIKFSVSSDNICLEKYCSKCGAPMELKNGKFGEFLGCSRYPICKHTKKIPIIGNYNTNICDPYSKRGER